jgi:ATP-dependent Clp protease ATP-binding subunit ClpA
LLDRLPAAGDAVFKLSEVIRRNHVARFSNSPLGVFGVHAAMLGDLDTLARVLAEELFGDPENVVDIELSEFTESHAVSTLIGSPPGYVGHDRPGLLATAAGRTPFAVYLWRSIDLADPAVLNVVEHILKEGVVTDRQGTRLHYSNTVHLLVLSEAAGTKRRRAAGFLDADTAKISTREPFARHLPGSLLGAVDEFIELPVPTGELLADLITRELQALAKDVEISYGIRLRIDDDLINELVKTADPENDPEFLRDMRDRVLKGVVKHVTGGTIKGELVLRAKHGVIDALPLEDGQD